LKNARQDRFDFLGYSFGPHRYKANGKWYLSASPSKKSMQRFKTKVGNLLVPGNNDPWPESARHAEQVVAWLVETTFCHGTRQSAFHSIDRYVYERVPWTSLARRHKVAGRGTHRFLSRRLSMEKRGLLRLERLPRTACCVPLGESSRRAGCLNRARSGSMSGDGKTERCQMAQATALIPRLYRVGSAGTARLRRLSGAFRKNIYFAVRFSSV